MYPDVVFEEQWAVFVHWGRGYCSQCHSTLAAVGAQQAQPSLGSLDTHEHTAHQDC